MNRMILLVLLAALGGCTTRPTGLIYNVAPVEPSTAVVALGAAQDQCYSNGNQPGTDEMQSCVEQRLSGNASALAIARGQPTVATSAPRTPSYQTPSYSTPRPIVTRRYILGPRGGCYYINSNGNKTYVDRSLCW